MKTIQSNSELKILFDTVVNGGYCIGCGACTAVQGSPISIKLDSYGRFCATSTSHSNLEEVNIQSIAVCPFSDQSLNEDQIGKVLYGNVAEFDHAIGYYLETFTGFVVEGDFRERGGSGGMGKWILYKLFKTGLVDAVVHVVQNESSKSDGLLYMYSVVNSIEDISNGSKSVYYPIEMSRILQHIKEHRGRYAVVGLPCFIKAIRLLSMSDHIFLERIHFCIGLVCGHLKSIRYADMYALQAGIEPSNLVSIDFRKKLSGRKANEKGVELVGIINGKVAKKTGVAKGFFGTDYNLGFFKYKACDYCDDIVAETADVAIGDAWLPEYLEDGRGTNVIVVRHPQIQELLKQEVSKGHLHLERISPERIIKSQEACYRHRREGLAYRLFLKDKAGEWHPQKRVKPKSTHLGKNRQKIYKIRICMAEESHVAFNEAMNKGNFSVFQDRMEGLLSQYTILLNRAPIWRRFLSCLLRRSRSFWKGFIFW